MAFGAVGFFSKQTSAEAVGRAVRGVHAGRTFYSPSVASIFGITTRRLKRDIATQKRSTYVDCGNSRQQGNCVRIYGVYKIRPAS
jgi:DNA-binding NarL/FixJ family response regulator